MEINNLTKSSIDENFLKKVAKIVLKGENKSSGEISLALIGPGRIRELNKKYRKKDKATDVLSFQESKDFLEGLGEIVICLREVKKNSKKFKVDFQEELARILIHGILHLLGYDHEKSRAKAREMEKKQESYLSQALKS
ncbi:MAG TPA: rRNA maturation RNase YbeY [Candidatus Parcubacteria bacterium]|jgi:probable rRNA maturation factor|nr:rRNA maturation RNase YbeY [Parcubacteria group bacterium]HJN62102.1 rRNA maturation RNase YbeY [Candidatus Parcubacteria bacterium]|tara:strand:- start:1911 stop:2327 length:417 start_codon:yes stop_codon:yes gene_type:complete